MRNTIVSVLISAFLVGLIYIIYMPSFGGDVWLEESGMRPADLGPIQALPFIILFAGWYLYLMLFRWIYQGMNKGSFRDAAEVIIRLWLFLCLPVIAAHYLFLQFSWKIILLDSVSQLLAMAVGGVLYWLWCLQPKKM